MLHSSLETTNPFQGRLYPFNSVIGVSGQLAGEGLVQQGLLEGVEGGELALVEGFEALGLFV